MELYDILANRQAINLLWLAYVREVIERKGYTTKFSEIKEDLKITKEILNPLGALDEAKLITYEYVEGEYYISITEKGKKFIEGLSKLKDVFLDIKEKPKLIKIDYELNEFEKKILVLAVMLAKEQGTSLISIKNLCGEIYPTESHKEKSPTILRHIKKLEDLNLVSKYKTGRENYISVTQAGERISNEYLNKVNNFSNISQA